MGRNRNPPADAEPATKHAYLEIASTTLKQRIVSYLQGHPNEIDDDQLSGILGLARRIRREKSSGEYCWLSTSSEESGRLQVYNSPEFLRRRHSLPDELAECISNVRLRIMETL